MQLPPCLRYAFVSAGTCIFCEVVSQVPDSETEVEQVAYLGGWPSYDLYRHHHGVAEFSVVGCANVGTSSLLNMITGEHMHMHMLSFMSSFTAVCALGQF